MNERGVSKVSALGNAAGATTHVARMLSTALVKDAIAHVNKHLGDVEWVRANRRLHQGVAIWELSGNNLLTTPERSAVGEAYKDEEWHDVSVAYQNGNESNWRITFQLE
jgi:wobble nucleotide-excising tRNase